MSAKSKGTNAERDLIHKFWALGWAAIRVAGSGSCHYPAPDVLAGNNLRKVAIECKCSGEEQVYLTKKEITELRDFAIIFGAESWVAVKFDRNDWFFLTLEDLKETDNSFVVNKSVLKIKGLAIDELIR